MFSCEFCEIFKSNFFTEHLRTTAFQQNTLENMNKKKEWTEELQAAVETALKIQLL